MPPTFTGTPIGVFYAAFWAWFHAHYGVAPLRRFGGPARGPVVNSSWGGWQRNMTGVYAGVGFSGGKEHVRVAKVELYADDVASPAWARVLHAVTYSTTGSNALWSGLASHVHRHASASPIKGSPGVYSIRDAAGVSALGYAPTAVPTLTGPVPSRAEFGSRPTSAVVGAVGIERCGKAGRVCAFHQDVFDLTNAADVQRMADWMHQSLLVYTAALAQILP